jgi:hypothetical protein
MTINYYKNGKFMIKKIFFGNILRLFAENY